MLDERLTEYNESNAVMELVLFQQAMEHVTRIARIIDQPRWVGGRWGGARGGGRLLLVLLGGCCRTK